MSVQPLLTAVCRIAVFCLVVSAGALPAAESAPGRFVDRIYTDAAGEHKYVVFEPAGYHPGRKWPVLFYLHGASGRGTDGRSPLIVGMGPAVQKRAATLPFLVVFPQNENQRSRLLGGWTDEPEELDRALKILDQVERDYAVDRQHEVLVGTSMGGFGVWELAARNPQRWRAIAPISGGGSNDQIPALAKVPVWAFHALDDTLVPPSRSSDLVNGIRQAGGRAYVSLLPKGGHNISRQVLSRDEVFEWFLHPEREPKLDIDWTVEYDLPNLMDQMPFVPGAEVPAALQVHVGRDLLQSWAALLPSLVPADALSGWKAGTVENSAAGMFRFSVVTGGIQYTGTLERAWMEPLPGNQLRVQLGLRSMQMTILSTHIRGRLWAADAGPMTIFIGYNAPVWLSIDVAPRIADRRLFLDLLSVNFQIPPDNWSVSQPNVSVRGLPFLRNRISGELQQGVAEKRPMIEAEIRNSVPGMIAQIEKQIFDYQNKVVSFGRWPMPLWQPRFKFYPESLTIGERGIDLVVGTTVAQIGKRPAGSQLLKFPPQPGSGVEIPVDGLEIAVSERVITAWSGLLAESNVNRFDVLDMSSPEFRRLGERSFWDDVLPSVRDLPADVDLKTEFALMQPLDLRNGSANAAGLQSDLTIGIPQLRLQLSTRQPGQREYQLYAEFDLSTGQGYRIAVHKASFMRRELQQALLPSDTPVVRVHQLPAGVSAADIAAERIGEQFALGWQKNFEVDERATQLNDFVLAKLPLRWDAVGWDGERLVARWQRPGILIVNASHAPVTYVVRSLNSPWSEPLTLGPGEKHEFRPPSALVWQQQNIAGVQQYRISLGDSIELRQQGPVSRTAETVRNGR